MNKDATAIDTTPFCIDFTDSTTDGVVTISRNTAQTLSYGFNPDDLSQIASRNSRIDVPKGSKLYMVGNKAVTRLFSANSAVYNQWTINGNNVKLSGNINCLLGNPGINVLGTYAFASFFRENDSIVDVSELKLPSMILADYCYNRMFEYCSNLTTAPELRSTTLANNCYYNMFSGTNLTTAPELPATTLANYCYFSMFRNCPNLKYVKCLATDISAQNCTAYWLDSVASNGTFVKAKEMNSWTTGTGGIPSGWTVVNA